MNEKELLVDQGTMEFQQKQEQTLYGGTLNPPALSLHSYQIWNGERLILHISPNKGHQPNDCQENTV